MLRAGLPSAAAGAPCDHGAGGGCDPSPPGVTTAKLLVASKVCVNPQLETHQVGPVRAAHGDLRLSGDLACGGGGHSTRGGQAGWGRQRGIVWGRPAALHQLAVCRSNQVPPSQAVSTAHRPTHPQCRGAPQGSSGASSWCSWPPGCCGSQAPAAAAPPRAGSAPPAQQHGVGSDTGGSSGRIVTGSAPAAAAPAEY